MKKRQAKKNFMNFVTHPEAMVYGVPILNALKKKIGKWPTERYFRKLVGLDVSHFPF